MKRTIFPSIPIEANQRRIRIQITSDPCPRGLTNYRTEMMVFLRTLGESPDLLSDGVHFCDRVLLYHDGSCWIVDAETTVEENPP